MLRRAPPHPEAGFFVRVPGIRLARAGLAMISTVLHPASLPFPGRGFLCERRLSVENVGFQLQSAVALPFENKRREATDGLSILIGRRPVRSPVNGLVGAACVDQL